MPNDIFDVNINDKCDDTNVIQSFNKLKELIRTGNHHALCFVNTLIRKNPNEITFKILRSQLILSDKNRFQELNLCQEAIKRYFYDARCSKS